MSIYFTLSIVCFFLISLLETVLLLMRQSESEIVYIQLVFLAIYATRPCAWSQRIEYICSNLSQAMPVMFRCNVFSVCETFNTESIYITQTHLNVNSLINSEILLNEEKSLSITKLFSRVYY